MILTNSCVCFCRQILMLAAIAKAAGIYTGFETDVFVHSF